MQLTVKRSMTLLGAQRKPGEVLDVVIGNKVGEITDQSLRALVNMGAVEAEGVEPTQGSSAIAQHLRAKVDNLEDKHKKLLSSHAVLQQAYDDLAKRVEALESGAAKPKLSKREARAAVSKE